MFPLGASSRRDIDGSNGPVVAARVPQRRGNTHRGAKDWEALLPWRGAPTPIRVPPVAFRFPRRLDFSVVERLGKPENMHRTPLMAKFGPYIAQNVNRTFHPPIAD
jgi:hypothetical protein